MRFYEASAGDGSLAVQRKADRSPLTEADLASHETLESGLRALTPELPILSEESDHSSIKERHQWRRFWLVDPLDGTREFIERSGEFTINIALVDDGRPVLGFIHEPLRGITNIGVPGQGAWRATQNGAALRWQTLRTRQLPERELVVLSSHRHRNERLAATLELLSERYHLERRNSGSALKFCDLAAGRGDVYPRFSLCSEWDVAAGDALVNAAGGQLWGVDGQPLRYNARDTLLSPHFVAVGDPRQSLWEELLQHLPEVDG